MPEIKNPMQIRLSSRIRFRSVGDEGVLVHLENGRVLVVNAVGLYIVQEISRQALSVVELADSVAGAFGVDMAQAQIDVAAFLDQMREEQAIENVP